MRISGELKGNEDWREMRWWGIERREVRIGGVVKKSKTRSWQSEERKQGSVMVEN